MLLILQKSLRERILEQNCSKLKLRTDAFKHSFQGIDTTAQNLLENEWEN